MLNPFTQISGMIRSVDNEINQLGMLLSGPGKNNNKIQSKLEFLRNNKYALEKCLRTYMEHADFSHPMR